MHFLGLPAELLEGILLRLDLKSLIACQSVSNLLRNAIQDSVDLRYRMALQRSGNLDNPLCTLSPSQKLDLLERSEFLWSSKAFVPPCMDGSGRLANQLRITNLLGFTDRFLIYGARDAAQDERKTTHLIYTLQPSSVDSVMNTTASGVPARDWIIPPPTDFGFDGMYVLGLTTSLNENGIVVIIYGCPDKDDPSSVDVVVVIVEDATIPAGATRRLHVCSMRRDDLENPHLSANAEVSGDNLALIICADGDTAGSPCALSVIDWKTGRPKFHDRILQVGSACLAFLTSDLLLVPDINSGSIHLYRIPSSEDLQEEEDSLSNLHVATFMLPDIISNLSVYVEIAIQCSPNPAVNGLRNRSAVGLRLAKDLPANDSAPPFVERPYLKDPMTAIMAITMKIASRADSEDRGIGVTMLRLLIHRQSLLDQYLLRLKSPLTTLRDDDVTASHSPNDTEGVIEIPWEQWGPIHGRWLNIPITQPQLIDGVPGSNLRKFCVYGERCIVPIPRTLRSTEILDPANSPEKDMVRTVAYLYDFNQVTTRIMDQNTRAMAGRPQDDDEAQPQLVHSGVRLGVNPKIKEQMEYVIFRSDDQHSSENKWKLRDARVFKNDPEGGVVGVLPCVRYTLPGLPNMDDIAIDARRIIQRELEDSTDTMILSQYFG